MERGDQHPPDSMFSTEKVGSRVETLARTSLLQYVLLKVGKSFVHHFQDAKITRISSCFILFADKIYMKLRETFNTFHHFQITIKTVFNSMEISQRISDWTIGLLYRVDLVGRASPSISRMDF